MYNFAVYFGNLAHGNNMKILSLAFLNTVGMFCISVYISLVQIPVAHAEQYTEIKLNDLAVTTLLHQACNKFQENKTLHNVYDVISLYEKISISGKNDIKKNLRQPCDIDNIYNKLSQFNQATNRLVKIIYESPENKFFRDNTNQIAEELNSIDNTGLVIQNGDLNEIQAFAIEKAHKIIRMHAKQKNQLSSLSEKKESKKNKQFTTNKQTYLAETPNKYGNIITTIQKEETVLVISVSDATGWYYVKYRNLLGYMQGDDLSK